MLLSQVVLLPSRHVSVSRLYCIIIAIGLWLGPSVCGLIHRSACPYVLLLVCMLVEKPTECSCYVNHASDGNLANFRRKGHKILWPRKAQFAALRRKYTLLSAAPLKGEVKAKIKISPVVVFGVLSRMVLVRES